MSKLLLPSNLPIHANSYGMFCALNFSKAKAIHLSDNLTPPPSPMPMDCRCGAEGDGNILADELTTIECSRCHHWSHIACQRNGSASNLQESDQWLCYACNINDTLLLTYV
jgi:hypothetical protein